MARMVNAVVPLYGSKRQMAATIVDALGPHTAYLAPFVGSCAVEFVKPPCRMEVLNDLSGKLINLIRVVQRDELAPSLFDRLARTVFCEELYRDSVAKLAAGDAGGLPWAVYDDLPSLEWAYPSLEWAYHYFVASWMGRNGLAGTTLELKSGFCVRYTSGGGDPAQRFRQAVESLPGWWARLRNCTILRRDGIELCERFEDRAGSVVYADPPYLSKQATYTHDFTEDDHKRLAAALCRFRETRVVVSYYADSRLAELYPGWRVIPVAVRKNLAVRAGNEPAPEVLLVNQP